jgi:nuclear transport factor 2 (NTF2) superfamily protein
VEINSDTVRRWLDAYSDAWETYDPAKIGSLFTDDAEYRWHPWDEGDEVAHGRQRIVAVWMENRDAPGTYRGTYRPVLVKDDVAIAVGTSIYYSDDSRETIDRVYHNLWMLHFADDGRCRSFTEWYMQAPS